MQNPYVDLIPHSFYRLAHNADDRHLRGAMCVFLEYVNHPAAGIRARVSLVKDGGIYYVKPGIIINA